MIRQPLPQAVATLPVMSLATEIASSLSSGNVLLRAEPGAGKSTGLPLALLLGGVVNGKIILLEPRKIAARSVAQRLASHLGESVGQSIGLRMRSDTRVSSATRLEVVTEGVLTRLLQRDPALEGVGLVIFDEFHERSIHADLGLALCLEVQEVLRDDLRLLLMSATLDTHIAHDRLRDATVFDCAVRQHPVVVNFLGEQSAPLPNTAASTVIKALDEQTGDILVFLPGVAEINRTAERLSQQLRDSNVVVHKLHGGVSSSAQASATAPANAKHRRVILSTSLAETSITIDGVTIVIDSGLERRGRIDTSTGAQLLETVTASQASATQRSGRAGRTSAGSCYRLWSEAGHSRRPAQWQPEILRADVSGLLMELGLWGADSQSMLPWLTPPPQASLSRAKELLARLGLWEKDRLSEHGRTVATLPVHPRFGHMLVWAAGEGVLGLASRLVALLEEQRLPGNAMDIESVLSASLQGSVQHRANQLERLVDQLAVKITGKNRQPGAATLLAQAFPDWIAQARAAQSGQFLLACGAGVTVRDTEALAHSEWLVVTQMGGAGKSAQVFRAIALDIEELEHCSGELFEHTEFLDWDERLQRVIGEQRTMLGSLLLDAHPMRDISDADKATALIKGIRKKGLQCLPWNEDCLEWQARVQRMAELTNGEPISQWPAVDDESLARHLDTWLLPFLGGVGSMKALQQLNLVKVLDAMLDYQQQTQLDAWLPRRYTVPSGSSVCLRYTEPGNPVLSVRLQELLGCSDNPSVANGRLPLKVELLSPARRPIQLTEDLAGFWTGSYPQIRKEMAGRYPKHIWPENPLEALPTTRAKPRKPRR